MSEHSSDYLQRLNRLKGAFVDSCGPRGQVIERAYAALQLSDAGSHAESLQCLRDEAHKLAGAAGSFGFQPLSDAARQVELDCSRLLASGLAPGVADKALIDRLLQRMGDARL